MSRMRCKMTEPVALHLRKAIGNAARFTTREQGKDRLVVGHHGPKERVGLGAERDQRLLLRSHRAAAGGQFEEVA